MTKTDEITLIKGFMKVFGITQKDIAKRLYCDQSLISKKLKKYEGSSAKVNEIKNEVLKMACERIPQNFAQPKYRLRACIYMQMNILPLSDEKQEALNALFRQSDSNVDFSHVKKVLASPIGKQMLDILQIVEISFSLSAEVQKKIEDFISDYSQDSPLTEYFFIKEKKASNTQEETSNKQDEASNDNNEPRKMN